MQLVLFRCTRSVLMTTSALMGAAVMLFSASQAHAVFDPAADTVARGPAVAISGNALPDLSVLERTSPDRPLGVSHATPATDNPYISPLAPIALPQPLYPAKIAGTPPVATPGVTAPATARVVAPAVQAPPVSPVITPAPVIAQSAPAPIALPPVDAATAARAQAMLRSEKSMQSSPLPTVMVEKSAPQSSPVAITVPSVAPAPAAIAVAPLPVAVPAALPSATSGGFIAPAPVFAGGIATSAQPQPAATTAAPAAVATLVRPPVSAPAAPLVAQAPIVLDRSTAPATSLSEQTRSILGGIPSRIDTAATQKPSSTALRRVSPQIEAVLGKDAQEEAYESVGLSIKVRRPGLDTNYELNQAYAALMGGDTPRAIEIYKNIVSAEPRNEDALFGLAATYHRLGETAQAKPFYGMLLKQNPNHREGLNNFLVLVSDESPQDALPELERLELRNPDFSPIPAQIAIVLDKLGYADKAEEKMLRAIELAPDNLTYKYNLAIMLDHHRRYADAAALYRVLIEASLRGSTVPAPLESMQKRLTYITTAATQARAANS